MNTILFDLDGTLLQISNKDFEKYYFNAMAQTMSDLYQPEELMDLIWSCTIEMVQDLSATTNEESFFNAMLKRVSEEHLNLLKPRFDIFYQTRFDELKKGVQDNQRIRDAVKIAKEKGYRLIIATNPMFPKLAIDKRIEWSGVNRLDFDYVTSFEKNHYCKPQIHFYEEILNDIQARPIDCLMVGNDAYEDMIAKNLGLKTYLLTDQLIESKHAIESDYKGNMNDFYQFITSLQSIE